MKRPLIDYLKCLDCSSSDWDLRVQFETEKEIRTGTVLCRACQRAYTVEEGLINALNKKLPQEVLHEKEHAESFGYIIEADGKKHPINRETIHHFRDLLLTLPAGDGSHYFRPGGSFDNQGGNAERFYKTLDLLKLSGKERVLEVGASFSWGSWRFAQRGCEVVALDVTNYLKTSDIYMENDGTYFERVMADMSALPFRDGSFDIIFSHSVIHHCKELDKLFSEFYRVLKPGGRVVALHECAFGLLEDKSGKALQEAIHEGFNENAYTLPQWKKGAKQGGFADVQFHFFSLIDDYIYRKKLRKSPLTTKLKAAVWIQKCPPIHGLFNVLTRWPRIILRPKAWMMIAARP